MTTLQERLAGAAASPAVNPANPPEKAAAVRKRVSMSTPTPKLSVPDIAGLRLYWMRGDAARIAQAHRAGYRFIEQHEVDLSSIGLGNQADIQGSTDLGSRVSVVAGGLEEGGVQASRLYLMGLPEELWLADQAEMAERNEKVAAAIRNDQGMAEAGGDNSHRYVPRGSPNQTIFHPKPRRAA